MLVVRFSIDKELRKAAQGKKTKVPVGILLFNALRDYPAIQAQIGDAFGITEDPA